MRGALTRQQCKIAYDPKKRFKVVCQKGKLPWVAAMNKFPHLTVLVAVNAYKKDFKPFIILKQLQNVKSLSRCQANAYFAIWGKDRIIKHL
jgi:hypothetical protein